MSSNNTNNNNVIDLCNDSSSDDDDDDDDVVIVKTISAAARPRPRPRDNVIELLSSDDEEEGDYKKQQRRSNNTNNNKMTHLPPARLVSNSNLEQQPQQQDEEAPKPPPQKLRPSSSSLSSSSSSSSGPTPNKHRQSILRTSSYQTSSSVAAVQQQQQQLQRSSSPAATTTTTTTTTTKTSTTEYNGVHRHRQQQQRQQERSSAAAAAAAAAAASTMTVVAPTTTTATSSSEKGKVGHYRRREDSASAVDNWKIQEHMTATTTVEKKKQAATSAVEQRRGEDRHEDGWTKPTTTTSTTVAEPKIGTSAAAAAGAVAVAGSSRGMKYYGHTRQLSMKATRFGRRLTILPDSSTSPVRSMEKANGEIDDDDRKKDTDDDDDDDDDDEDDDMSTSSSDTEDEDDRLVGDSIQRKDQPGNKMETESTQEESIRASTSFRRVSTEVSTDDRKDEGDNGQLNPSALPSVSTSTSSSSPTPGFDDDMTFNGTESECDDLDIDFSPNDRSDVVENKDTPSSSHNLETPSKATTKTTTTVNVETATTTTTTTVEEKKKKKRKRSIVQSNDHSETFSMTIQERVKSRRKDPPVDTLHVQAPPAAATKPLSTSTSNVADQSKSSSTTKKKTKKAKYLTIVPGFPQESLDPETKMPVLRIAVYDNKNYNTVFKFCIRVKPSLIPGAGMGAHLTYEGAMRLKVTSMCHDHEEESPRQPAIEEKFHEPLEAICPSGEKLAIKLRGRVIEDRSQKPPIENYDDVADMPFPDRLAGKMINLGSYGPLLSSDRKTSSQYMVKNFIFSNKPEEYGYDVDSSILTSLPYYIEPVYEDQVLDITDDFTGLPHSEARKKIYMYINECGHSKQYVQNVHSEQNEGHAINYSFIASPMMKNEQVELLVDWFESYEPTRQRRGYGRNNLLGVAKSDDDIPTRFLRNFAERVNVSENHIEYLGIWSLYHTCDFLSSIFSHISLLAEAFLSTGDDVLTVHQVIALRRMQWLAPFLAEQLNRIDDYLDKNRPNEAYMNGVLVTQCKKWIENLSWNKWTALFDKIDSEPLLKDNTGANFAILWDEVVEEICFDVRHRLIMPMDQSTYCGVARGLINRLCVTVARQNCAHLGNDKKCKILAGAFIEKARVAANNILHESRDDLVFDSSNIVDRYVLQNARIIKKLRSKPKIYLVKSDEESYRPAHLPVNKPSNSIQFHHQWYLCRQVAFIVNVFAERFMSDTAAKLLKEQMCKEFSIPADSQQHLLDHEIKVSEDEEHYSLFQPPESSNRREERIEEENSSQWDAEIYHKEEQVDAVAKRMIEKQAGIPKTQKRKRPKRKGSGGQRSSAGNLLFFALVFPVLEERGWEMEKGNRAQDFYLLPKGIRRGGKKSTGGLYQNRIDFFDSVPTALHALEHDKRWKDIPDVKRILSFSTYVRHEWVNIIAKAGTWPKGGTMHDKIEWIISNVGGPKVGTWPVGGTKHEKIEWIRQEIIAKIGTLDDASNCSNIIV